MQSDWMRAFSVTTQELDFSQPYRFDRFPKAAMVHHLKPKNHTDEKNITIFFFQNLYCRFISEHFGNA